MMPQAASAAASSKFSVLTSCLDRTNTRLNNDPLPGRNALRYMHSIVNRSLARRYRVIRVRP
jgi:hypothetical protein